MALPNSLANFTAKNSKNLKYSEVQLLGSVVGLPFLKDTFITGPLGKGFEVNDAFRVKNIATGGDAAATDAATSLDIDVVGDKLALATNSNLLDSTALGNVLIAARMTKVMNYFHTDSGAAFGNDVAGNTLSNGNRLRLALNFVSPSDADAFDDSVAVQIMPANTLASIVDKDGNPLIWATSQWETIVNGSASGNAAAPWAVAIVASGNAAAVNLESKNSYSDLDEYTKCALAVSPFMMAKKPVKLVGAFNQSNNANIVKSAKYYNATWDSNNSQLLPTTIGNVESSEILKVAQSFTGFPQAKWADIDGIAGLTNQCKIQFQEQLITDFTSQNTTPFNNTQYTTYVQLLSSQKVIGVSQIQFNGYNVNTGVGAIAFVNALINYFPSMTSQQADRALSSFTNNDCGYTYFDDSNILQTVSNLSLPVLAKKLISGASPSGYYIGDLTPQSIVDHAKVESYILTGANFQSKILATASSSSKEQLITIFDNYLAGEEELLNRLVDAVHTTRPDVTRDTVALELAQNLNAGGATTNLIFDNRVNRFSSASTKQNLLAMLVASYNARNGNDALANIKIVRNLTNNGMIKVGSKSSTMDSASAQDAEFGVYSNYNGLIGNSTQTKDAVTVNANNANGTTRTFPEKMAAIAIIGDNLQAVLGYNDKVAVQQKWSSMAVNNGAAVFASGDFVNGLATVFPTRSQQDIVGEFRSVFGTTATVAANLHAPNLTAAPIHSTKLNSSAADIKVNKRALWLIMSKLADVSNAGVTRTLVALNAPKLTADDGKELISAFYEKRGTFTAAADGNALDAHNSARILDEVVKANATLRLSEVVIDSTLSDSFSNALALHFANTTTTHGTAPTAPGALVGGVVLAQFTPGTNNTFANMASLITPVGAQAIKSIVEDYATIFANPSLKLSKFVSEVGSLFTPNAVLLYYTGYLVGDEEISTAEAINLISLGVSKSAILGVSTVKFGLLSDGRTLSATPSIAYLFNQNNASLL